MSLDELLAEALKLSDRERAELAGQLLASLEEGPVDDGYLEAWDAELERRLASIGDGTGRLVAADEVLAAARARLPGK